ncbi:MAG: hypothetical protein OSA98_24985 [Rubripirellula sp.]|nr:hypothetical protein [Rubripirellula sp.]
MNDTPVILQSLHEIETTMRNLINTAVILVGETALNKRLEERLTTNWSKNRSE